MKTVYALSDERCQAFSPDEKTTTFGGQAERVKLTDLPISFLPLPATTPTTSVYQDVSQLVQSSLTAAAASAACGNSATAVSSTTTTTTTTSTTTTGGTTSSGATKGAKDDGGTLALTQTVKGLAGIVQQTVLDHNRLSGERKRKEAGSARVNESSTLTHLINTPTHLPVNTPTTHSHS